MSATERLRFLRKVPLFEGLSEVDLTTLSEMLMARAYKRGNVIFFEGDPGDVLYIVRSGLVKVYRVTEDGREKTLAFMGEGESFGEMALLDGGSRSAIAETLEPTTVYALHRSDFHAILAERPTIALEVIRILSRRLRQTNAQIMDVVFRDVRGRIVQTLLKLVDRHGVAVPDGRMIGMKLTHQEIANLVGTSRETVSRILAELQDQGLARVEGRNLVLTEVHALEEYAAGF